MTQFNATLKNTEREAVFMLERTHVVHISGMTCSGCSGRVSAVLMSNPGIIEANISHDTNSGVIVTDDSISTQKILEMIQRTGFEANEK